MMIKDTLGDRMKEYYEDRSKTSLSRRTPVAIRIDGKCFHSFTKGMVKPFDSILVKTMQDTMKYLCENIQGCVLGYTQSDEITLILQDYKELGTNAWFDYEVQKVCSISASLATLAFNKFFMENVAEMTKDEEEFKKYAAKFNKALFDSRCFNIPKEEVNNLLIWRQLDAERNSVSSVAQANFPHKELQGVSTKQAITKLETEKGIIWGDLPTTLKRGSCCVKKTIFLDKDGNEVFSVNENELYKLQHIESETDEAKIGTNGGTYKGQPVTIRSKWTIDNEIPRFTENNEYVDLLVYVGN